jgi:hypothetical protein
VPSPTVIELHTMRSTPSDSSAAHVPTMSTIASTIRPRGTRRRRLGTAVHGAFHIGKHAEGALRAVANALREVGGIDQLTDRPVACDGQW